MNAIGKTILKYRRLNKISQEDICKVMSVDLTTVGAWENGQLIPDGAALRKLSEMLEFPLEEIISETARENKRHRNSNIVLFCISAVLILLIVAMHLSPYVNYHYDYNGLIDGTVVELIANPERYHGKRVRVVAVGNLEFEGDFISLSKEDWQYYGEHRIWIDLGDIGMSYEEAQAYNGKYVIVEGVFNMFNRGHMSGFQGAIEDVSRYDLWFTED